MQGSQWDGDILPDAETALAVGRVILQRYYGPEVMDRFGPLEAMPGKGEWSVFASLRDTPEIAAERLAAEAQGNFLIVRSICVQMTMSARDGRVTMIGFGR
jgi:hypothetical protein